MSRSHAEMAQMRALCDPADPRDGRVLHQIRLAFWSFEGVGKSKPKGTPPAVTTKYLMSFTYPWEYQRGELEVLAQDKYHQGRAHGGDFELDARARAPARAMVLSGRQYPKRS